MSIIIRLQNLPISARTGDIRKFFGGLRIPDGGVHILGGDNGDAFIAFMSDEDARLAMRKDGGRIKDSRVKLFLSSRMEMQHEVEKVTKGSFEPSLLYEDITNMSSDSTRNRSHEKRRRSRSPLQFDDRDFKKSRPHDYQRATSPVIYSTKKSSPVKYRSRSPRRRSRSPKNKSFMTKRRSASPKGRDFHSLPADKDFSHFPPEDLDSQFLSPSKRQAELERRITEEIEKNAFYQKALREEESRRFLELQQHNLSLNRGPEEQMFSPDNVQHFKSLSFKNSYYIVMEGMEPNWSFREVQIILKGHYAPQTNIKMEVDDAGYKTGRAIVRLTNKDDFDNILKKNSFYFKGKRIAVKACPHFISQKYFSSKSDYGRDNYIPQNRDLCYILKGLPFTCTYEDVVAFFSGCEISDLVIFYGEDGQASGTAFVSFKRWKDFEEAFSQNGKKIGHRYIEMLPCTAREMAEAKRTQYGGNFIPYSQILSEKRLPNSRRPICAILTGLPLKVTTSKILAFFSESGLKPDAIHLTLSKKKLSDGRAFVEFSNYLDFDLALKFHGKKLDNHIVCIKQILYDEMVKILDSQKAKHYFASTDPAASTSVEPEKVPYLWEPPDGRREKEIHNKNNKGFLPPNKTSTPNSFKFNKNVNNSFVPNDNSRRNFDLLYPQDIAMSDSLHPMYPRGFESGPYDMERKNIDVIHDPIPYDKDFMSTQEDYYSTKKYEENIKSSRLSPENEAALLDFLNRDRKPFPGNNKMSRSLERRGRGRGRGKKYFKPRSRDHFRIEREEFYDDPVSPTSLHYDVDSNVERGGCIVQMSNVDTTIGTRDLLNFLMGFDFDENTLIRRYTDENLPTRDVRVTFVDRSEAERAIRILNKRFLHGQPVDMFIV